MPENNTPSNSDNNEITSQFFNIGNLIRTAGVFAGGGNALTALAAIGSSGLLNPSKPKTPDTGSTLNAITNFTQGMQQASTMASGQNASKTVSGIEKLSTQMETLIRRVENTNATLQKILGVQTGTEDINYQKTIRRNNRLSLLMSKTAMGRMTLAAMARSIGFNALGYENLTNKAISQGSTTHGEIMNRMMLDKIPFFGEFFSGYKILENKILQTKAEFTNESNISLTNIIPDRLQSIGLFASYINEDTTSIREYLRSAMAIIGNDAITNEKTYNSIIAIYGTLNNFIVANNLLSNQNTNLIGHVCAIYQVMNEFFTYARNVDEYLNLEIGNNLRILTETIVRQDRSFKSRSDEEHTFFENTIGRDGRSGFYETTMDFQTNVLAYLKVISSSVYFQGNTPYATVDERINAMMGIGRNGSPINTERIFFDLNRRNSFNGGGINRNNSSNTEKNLQSSNTEDIYHYTNRRGNVVESEESTNLRNMINLSRDLLRGVTRNDNLSTHLDQTLERSINNVANQTAHILNNLQNNQQQNQQQNNQQQNNQLAIPQQQNTIQGLLSRLVTREINGQNVTENQQYSPQNMADSFTEALRRNREEEEARNARNERELARRRNEEYQMQRRRTVLTENLSKQATNYFNELVNIKSWLIMISTRLPKLASRFVSTSLKLMMGFGVARMVYKVLAPILGMDRNEGGTGIGAVLSNTLGNNSMVGGMKSLGEYIKQGLTKVKDFIWNSETINSVKAWMSELWNETLWPKIKEYGLKAIRYAFLAFSAVSFIPQMIKGIKGDLALPMRAVGDAGGSIIKNSLNRFLFGGGVSQGLTNIGGFFNTLTRRNGLRNIGMATGRNITSQSLPTFFSNIFNNSGGIVGMFLSLPAGIANAALGLFDSSLFTLSASISRLMGRHPIINGIRKFLFQNISWIFRKGAGLITHVIKNLNIYAMIGGLITLGFEQWKKNTLANLTDEEKGKISTWTLIKMFIEDTAKWIFDKIKEGLTWFWNEGLSVIGEGISNLGKIVAKVIFGKYADKVISVVGTIVDSIFWIIDKVLTPLKWIAEYIVIPFMKWWGGRWADAIDTVVPGDTEEARQIINEANERKKQQDLLGDIKKNTDPNNQTIVEEKTIFTGILDTLTGIAKSVGDIFKGLFKPKNIGKGIGAIQNIYRSLLSAFGFEEGVKKVQEEERTEMISLQKQLIDYLKKQATSDQELAKKLPQILTNDGKIRIDINDTIGNKSLSDYIMDSFTEGVQKGDIVSKLFNKDSGKFIIEAIVGQKEATTGKSLYEVFEKRDNETEKAVKDAGDAITEKVNDSIIKAETRMEKINEGHWFFDNTNGSLLQKINEGVWKIEEYTSEERIRKMQESVKEHFNSFEFLKNMDTKATSMFDGSSAASLLSKVRKINDDTNSQLKEVNETETFAKAYIPIRDRLTEAKKAHEQVFSGINNEIANAESKYNSTLDIQKDLLSFNNLDDLKSQLQIQIAEAERAMDRDLVENLTQKQNNLVNLINTFKNDENYGDANSIAKKLQATRTALIQEDGKVIGNVDYIDSNGKSQTLTNLKAKSNDWWSLVTGKNNGNDSLERLDRAIKENEIYRFREFIKNKTLKSLEEDLESKKRTKENLEKDKDGLGYQAIQELNAATKAYNEFRESHSKEYDKFNSSSIFGPDFLESLSNEDLSSVFSDKREYLKKERLQKYQNIAKTNEGSKTFLRNVEANETFNTGSSTIQEAIELATSENEERKEAYNSDKLGIKTGLAENLININKNIKSKIYENADIKNKNYPSIDELTKTILSNLDNINLVNYEGQSYKASEIKEFFEGILAAAKKQLSGSSEEQFTKYVNTFLNSLNLLRILTTQFEIGLHDKLRNENLFELLNSITQDEKFNEGSKNINLIKSIYNGSDKSTMMIAPDMIVRDSLYLLLEKEASKKDNILTNISNNEEVIKTILDMSKRYKTMGIIYGNQIKMLQNIRDGYLLNKDGEKKTLTEDTKKYNREEHYKNLYNIVAMMSGRDTYVDKEGNIESLRFGDTADPTKYLFYNFLTQKSDGTLFFDINKMLQTTKLKDTTTTTTPTQAGDSLLDILKPRKVSFNIKDSRPTNNRTTKIDEEIKNYTIIDNNANIENLNPELKRRLLYYSYNFYLKHNKKPVLTSGYRTIPEQEALYQKYMSGRSQYMAAKGGQSRHNYGFAIDMSVKNSSIDKELLAKSGLVQPYPIQDPIHIEGIEWSNNTLDEVKRLTPKKYNFNNLSNNIPSNNQSIIKTISEKGDNPKDAKDIANSPEVVTTGTPPSTTNTTTTSPKIVSDALNIFVDKGKQELYVYKGNELIKTYKTTTGLNPGDKKETGDKRTPVGQFSIIEILNSKNWLYPNKVKKGERQRRGTYGPWFLRLSYEDFEKKNSIGIHGTDEPDLLGKPGSHGCVRISNENIEELKKMVKVGQPVIIAESFANDNIKSIIKNNNSVVQQSGGWKEYYKDGWKDFKGQKPWSRYLYESGLKYDVDPELISALIMQESGGQDKISSSKGARGLMQLMPPTARSLGLNVNEITGTPDERTDPKLNIDAGTKYLSQQLNEYKNVKNALTAYNWGPGNMDKYLKTGKGTKGQPIPDEANEYAKKVMANYGKHRFTDPNMPINEALKNGDYTYNGSGNTSNNPSISQLTTDQLLKTDAEIEDYKNKYLAFKSSKINFNSLNTEFKRRIVLYAKEYFEKYGKKPIVTSAFRSRSDQEALYKANPNKAAKPGSSRHEYGFAIDIGRDYLEEPLLNKYGLKRPFMDKKFYEPWHVEGIEWAGKKPASLFATYTPTSYTIGSGVNRNGTATPKNNSELMKVFEEAGVGDLINSNDPLAVMGGLIRAINYYYEKEHRDMSNEIEEEIVISNNKNKKPTNIKSAIDILSEKSKETITPENAKYFSNVWPIMDENNNVDSYMYTLKDGNFLHILDNTREGADKKLMDLLKTGNSTSPEQGDPIENNIPVIKSNIYNTSRYFNPMNSVYEVGDSVLDINGSNLSLHDFLKAELNRLPKGLSNRGSNLEYNLSPKTINKRKTIVVPIPKSYSPIFDSGIENLPINPRVEELKTAMLETSSMEKYSNDRNRDNLIDGLKEAVTTTNNNKNINNQKDNITQLDGVLDKILKILSYTNLNGNNVTNNTIINSQNSNSSNSSNISNGGNLAQNTIGDTATMNMGLMALSI